MLKGGNNLCVNRESVSRFLHAPIVGQVAIRVNTIRQNPFRSMPEKTMLCRLVHVRLFDTLLPCNNKLRKRTEWGAKENGDI